MPSCVPETYRVAYRAPTRIASGISRQVIRRDDLRESRLLRARTSRQSLRRSAVPLSRFRGRIK
jgi:hypothetical protein